MDRWWVGRRWAGPGLIISSYGPRPGPARPITFQHFTAQPGQAHQIYNCLGPAQSDQRDWQRDHGPMASVPTGGSPLPAAAAAAAVKLAAPAAATKAAPSTYLLLKHLSAAEAIPADAIPCLLAMYLSCEESRYNANDLCRRLPISCYSSSSRSRFHNDTYEGDCRCNARLLSRRCQRLFRPHQTTI